MLIAGCYFKHYIVNKNKALLENQRLVLENNRSFLTNKKTILENKRAIPRNKRASLENKTVLLENKRTLLENKRAILWNKRTLLENKRVVLENRRAILGMKGHFCESKRADWLEGKGTCYLKFLWSGHFQMFQTKTRCFLRYFFPVGQISWSLNSHNKYLLKYKIHNSG